MKGFVRGITRALAFIAILAMQPVGQQYCTANDSLCCTATAESCDLHADNCCSKSSESNGEPPCCVEIFSKLPFVPSQADSLLPEPLSFDLPPLEPLLFHVEFGRGQWSATEITLIDPPPPAASNQTLFCVRLI